MNSSIFGILITLFCLAGTAKARAEIGMPTLFASPRNLPHSTPVDVEDALQLTPKVAKIAHLAVNWSDPNFFALAYGLVTEYRRRGLETIVGLDILPPTRKPFPRGPSDLGATISLSDPKVRARFIDDVRALAHLRVPFLYLGLEINYLVFNLNEYLAFVTLYKLAYDEIKKISPGTKVFTSFQYDLIYGMHRIYPQPNLVVDLFKPKLDLLAITSYPAPHFSHPSLMPPDYYRLANLYAGGLPIAVTEIGWPTRGPGDEQEQFLFILMLPSLLGNLRPVFSGWALLHDIDGLVPDWGDDLNSVGLRHQNGSAKLGYYFWQLIVMGRIVF